MRPGSPIAPQAVPRCVSSVGAGALLLASLSVPAFAQETPEPVQILPAASNIEDESQPSLPPPEFNEAGERLIAFEANELRYDDEADIISASGDVLLRSGDQSVRADSVSWNRVTGEIVAEGELRYVDADGNQIFADRLVLTDELEAGAMQNLLLAFRSGSRIAAQEAQRTEDGDIALDRAAYSSCSVIDADGCDKRPSWRVTAERVYYDADSQDIRFRNAYLELFGARLLPLPGLRIRADGSANSGIFIPNFGLTVSNGLEVSDTYYWRLADNRDLAVTGYLFTEAAPMASAQYRQLNENGAFQVTGYVTHSSRIPLNSNVQTTEKDLRYYLFGNGRFQFDEHWSATGSLRVSSDRTFLRRYELSREDRLRSTFAIERIDDSSYLSLSGWATQALLVSQDQGQMPLALPLFDYRKRFDDPMLGGKFELQANTLAVTRSEGQDTQRAFARARWDLRRLTPLGQQITLTGLVRGDVYHSDENELTLTESYRGMSGWQGRAIAIAALDMRWPFAGEFLGGTQIVTPRVQIVAAPEIRNLDIPNEDARAIDLEDSNLFALNRFPGYDRVEDGVRVTYGADWQVNFPGWRLKTTIGQSYRLSDKPTLFPNGTGLTDKFSDFVGRTEVRYRDFLKFTHRFRLDKDNFAVRRNEIDATLGSDRTYVELGYLRLNRDIAIGFEDLQDREEIRAAGRFSFARYWSVFGSAVVNLTDRNEDPTFTADGFEPLRTRLGIAYADDCLEIGVTWRRDYIELADAQEGSSFRFNIALKNIGFR